MSTEDLFSGETPQNTLQEPQLDDDKDYFEELVGEGKKFKDVKDLAKGKARSDAFIEQLKREQAELREELAKTKSIEEHLNDLRNAMINRSKQEGNIREMTPDHGSSRDENTGQNQSAANTPSPDDIQRLVAEEVNRRVSVEKQKQNIDSVIDAAKRVYGESYKQELTNKAKALGSSPDELFNIAEKNPQLFKSIMGLNETAGTPPVKQNEGTNRIFESTNTEALRSQHGSSNSQKKYADFEQLRKENPQEYFSPRVQNEMFQLAEKIGPAFFDK
jgi:hypothetical protein